jgi:hypothetical protein
MWAIRIPGTNIFLSGVAVSVIAAFALLLVLAFAAVVAAVAFGGKRKE